MDKQEAYKIVLEDLKKIPLFMGSYDACHGNEHFMHGVAAVMESIAYKVSDEEGDAFSDEFVHNLIFSEGESDGL